MAPPPLRPVPEAIGSKRQFSPLGDVSVTDRVALLVVLLHLLPVWWVISGGGLYLDDLRAQAYARNQPFWPFIVSSNGTHFAPAPRVLDWLQATYAPLEHGPAILVTLLVHLLLGLVGWVVLRELVGSRPAALLPLGLLVLSPALLSATAWYRQTLTTTTAVVLVLAAQLAVVKLVRRGSWRWGALTVALIALGMAFSERALAGCALLVTTALLIPGPPWRLRVRRVVGVTVPLALLAAAYLVVYRTGPFDQGNTSDLTLSDAGSLLVRSIGTGLVPALFGGPWRWAPSGPALSIADPPVPLTVLANGILLLWIARRLLDGRTRTRAMIGLAMAVSYVLPIEVFVLVGRYAAFGSVIGADLRLFADCSVVLVVALAVIALGWRQDPTPSDQAARPSDRRNRRQADGPGAWLLATLLLIVAAGGAAVSWAAFAHRWHTNGTPQYVAALHDDLHRLDRVNAPPTTVLPGPIPDSVIPAWMQKEISTLDLVALIRPETELAVGQVNTRIVAPSGHLVPARLRTVGTFDTGEDNFCHHPQQPGAAAPLTIAANDVVAYKRDELIQVGLLVNDERAVDVEVLDDSGTAHPLAWPQPRVLQRGPYNFRLRVPYGVSVAAVRIQPASAGMCVVSVAAVVPEAS
jgi:hypothetical protein